MRVLTTPSEMQAWALHKKREGETIAFVPTMGALHEGHLSLFREGKKRADHLVVSLFVNPVQFGPDEDLNRYPRDVEGDLKKAEQARADIAFMPAAEVLYPQGFQTSVSVEKLSQPLCGESRPGHFQGVAAVVLKFFNIIQPNVALFGQKDFQQLRVIQQMVQDLNLPVEIKPMPIVREGDGLAMSSRNRYLSPEERQAALSLSLALTKAQAMVERKVEEVRTILEMVQSTLLETKKIRIDYAKLCDPVTLGELKSLRRPALLVLACFVGNTRLIDNCVLK